MKILKKGNLTKIKQSFQFTCKKCGCVFIADKGEYQHFLQPQGEWVECRCPYCNNSVQADCFYS